MENVELYSLTQTGGQMTEYLCPVCKTQITISRTQQYKGGQIGTYTVHNGDCKACECTWEILVDDRTGIISISQAEIFDITREIIDKNNSEIQDWLKERIETQIVNIMRDFNEYAKADYSDSEISRHEEAIKQLKWVLSLKKDDVMNND